MRHIQSFVTGAFLCAVCSISAKPVIEFDTKEFDGGSFIEGTKDKIEAKFVVKNTGDEDLKLTSVKPSCGCTVVKYDSLVLPGKSTTINSTVNIRGKKGALSKSIAVISNADNDSNVRLIIKANILEALSASISSIDMTGDNQKTKTNLQLTSSKKDLKINDVTFVPAAAINPNGTPVKAEPVKVPFSLVPADTTRTDGLTSYRLELNPIQLNTLTNGDFVINTDHPDKKELRIPGKAGSGTNQPATNEPTIQSQSKTAK
jgi:hypothetical protein